MFGLHSSTYKQYKNDHGWTASNKVVTLILWRDGDVFSQNNNVGFSCVQNIYSDSVETETSFWVWIHVYTCICILEFN